MLNKIMLIGNLGRDPDMTYTPDGVAVTKFSLAVSRTYKSPTTGEKQKETEWFNIVAWRSLAETCSTYLHKGSKVYIEGRLTQRKYTDREGVQRTAIDVIASDMEMLTPKADHGDADASADDPLGDIDDHPF
jgi:single-strand DNA-binding protein